MEQESEKRNVIRLSQLGRREIICMQDGKKIGFVDDIRLDAESGKVEALVVSGGGIPFLWHSEDFIIPWENLRMIGQDAILVEGTYDTPASSVRAILEQIFSRYKSSRKKDV